MVFEIFAISTHNDINHLLPIALRLMISDKAFICKINTWWNKLWAKSIFAMGLITTFIDLQCCQLYQSIWFNFSFFEIHVDIFNHFFICSWKKLKLATLNTNITFLSLFCHFALLTHIDLYWNDLSNSLVDLWNLPYNLIEMVKNILFKQSNFFPRPKRLRKPRLKCKKDVASILRKKDTFWGWKRINMKVTWTSVSNSFWTWSAI